MPAATDNVLVVEQRLWTLALAWTPITSVIASGNRVRYDQSGTGQPDQYKEFRESLDQLPQLKLEILSSQQDQKAARTLCFQPDVHNVIYEWTAQGTDKTYNAVTQLIAELKACMQAAGVQLGIPSVVARWTWEWRMEIAPNQAANVAQHRQVRIRQVITIKG